MEALKGAAAFATGALAAQYGVRGSSSPAAALSAPSQHAASRLAALPPPASASAPPPSASASRPAQATSTATSTAASRLAASLGGGREAWTYVQAAAAVAAAGAAAAAAHAAASALAAALSRALFFDAEVDSRDDAYRWLMLWLSRHRALSDAPRVSVTTSLRAFGTSADCGLEDVGGGGGAADDDDDGDGQRPKQQPVALLPAPGTHIFEHEGRLFLVSRRRSPGNPHSPSNARLLSELLVLRTARRGGRSALLRLLAQAREGYASHTRGSTLVHSVDASACYWEPAGARPRRPLASVVLPGEGDGAALLADARRFLASGAWYASRGIPHRRGYLLYGPPGSGKSSLVAAIAAEAGLDVYAVTLSSPLLTDDGLRSLLNAAGKGGCLLLEDIDAAVAVGARVGGGKGDDNNNNNGGGPSSSSLTLAGVLNALDGVAAQEGRLLFMTTNHPERLDPALVRPGRVDVRVPFSRATRSQLRRLFERFFSGDGGGGGAASDAALAARFADALPEDELSLAEVQGLLLLHRDDPLAAVEAAERGALAKEGAAA